MISAKIITIGDEILIGQIVDTNSTFISKQLINIGIEVSEILSISDEKESILNALNNSLNKFDIVITTGGLGPTNDDITKEVYKSLEKAGAEILKAIAVYLNLPEDFFEANITDGNSILRAIHYFPIENPAAVPAEAVRAGAHEDINLITLLIGASADGLQILTNQNKWFPVTAIEDDIVVNVGDMLQRLTNNKLKSTTHRVVNPPVALMKTSRYSVPFFLHPKSEMDLSCLANSIEDGQVKKYDDITAGDYLEERLKEIGLK